METETYHRETLMETETVRTNLSESRTIRAAGIQWASIATKIGLLATVYDYLPQWLWYCLVGGVIVEAVFTGAVSYFRFDDWKRKKR